MRTIRPLIFLILMAISVGGAFGSTISDPAYSFDSISLASESPLSLGFWFKTNQAVLVTDLGYYDASCPGFRGSHNVGIFDGAGALLTETTIGAGTVDPLDGKFRYASITPILLPADTWFVLAGTTGGHADYWGYGKEGDIAGLNVSPLITVGSAGAVYLYQFDNVLRFPTNYWGYQFYVGPNMKMSEVEGVPEPASVAFIAIGVLAIGLGKFLKRA